VALAALFTVELGGKRGARIARARAQAMAVRAAAAEDEWELASRSYVAAFAWAHADRALALAREERAALDTLVGLSLARYREGSIGRLELARVQTEAGVAAMAEAAAERAVAVVRAELAAATGVPVDALGGARVSVPVLPGCAGADTMSRLSLQQEALGARWALRRAAAEYQAAEGDLRVEVANASPDLTLGPGMFFDQGTGKFTLASAVPSIPLGRNRGPIAEAEARRAAAGAHLAEVQEQVLAELESGLAACGAGGRSFQTVDSLARTVAERVRLARAAYDRGETGRLDVAVAELELRRVRRQRMELEAELAGAGLALERSRGAWGLRADGPWPAAVPWWPLNTGEE
jgi:CRISPR system Cascade subunit CasA